METLEKTVFEDESYHIVMAVFHKNDVATFEDFFPKLKEYLGTFGEIKVITVGYETEGVPRHHHHAHFLLKQERRMPQQLCRAFGIYAHKTTNFYGKNNISVKKTENKDIKSFKEILQYPLKEKPVRELCYGLTDETLDMLHRDGKAIHQGLLRYKKKQEDKQKRKQDGWERKSNWVKNNMVGNNLDPVMSRVCSTFIKYYMEEEDCKVPYRSKMEEEVIRWCLENKWASPSEIQQKYYRM